LTLRQYVGNFKSHDNGLASMYKFVGALSLAVLCSSVVAQPQPKTTANLIETTAVEESDYHTQASLLKKKNQQNGNNLTSVILEFEEKPIFSFANKSPSFISSTKQKLKNQRASVLTSLKNEKIATQYKREFSKLFHGASIDVEQHNLSKLKNIAGVKKVHIVKDRFLHLTESVGLIEADTVWQQLDAQDQKITGEGVTVAVLDSGVDYTRTELGGCFGEGCRVKGGYDYMNDDDDPMDDQGHGTHVAGIIGASGSTNGVAPNVDFFAYKICDYFCPTDGIIAALEHAVDPDGDPATDDGADIINMSLGGPGGLDDPLTVAVNALEEHDVLVVISAGNEGSGPMTIGSPGNAEYALTVASTDKADFLADYSSRGPVFSKTFQKPDIAAPGSSIKSLGIGSGIVNMSGTSMAAPHVAGAAALLKQNRPSLTARQLKSVLTSTTEPLLSSYLDGGAGRLNALHAVNSPIAMSKSQVFMGKVDRNVAKWQAEKTITLTNITDTQQTYSLSIPDEDKSISYSLSVASEQILAAGAKLDVTISVSVDTENVVAPGNLVHFANLEVSTEDAKASLPLLVLNAVEFSWTSNNFPRSVWINKKDGQLEVTKEYQSDGGLFLLNGDYIASAIFDNAEDVKWVASEFTAESEDIVFDLDQIEAPHKVSITSFVDHQGNTRTLDELQGAGVFAEIAHPDSNQRHYHFFTGWNQDINRVYLDKPLYISSLLPEYEVSISLMFGDTESSAYDQHLYLYSQTFKGIEQDVEIALDGQTESQFTIESKLPEYLEEKLDWDLFSYLGSGSYVETGWYTSGGYLTGPYWFGAKNSPWYLEQRFKINLHGNVSNNERIGNYSFNINDGNNTTARTTIGAIRFSETGTLLGNGETLVSDTSLRLNAEGNIVNTHIFTGSNNYASFDYSVLGSHGVKYANSLINSYAYTCDDTAYNRIFDKLGYANIDLTILAQCSKKRVEVFFGNYLSDIAFRSSVSSDIPDSIYTSFDTFRSLDLDSLRDANMVDAESLSLTGRFHGSYHSFSETSLSAFINYQGEWIELPVSLEKDVEFVNFDISIEPTTEPYLASLKLMIDVSGMKSELILNGAFILGGDASELVAYDRDEDGINDLVDLDSDNDGIANDIELISGLNPFDDSDALEDSDGDGLNNLEEAMVGRLLHIKDSDEYNDSDGDGVLDQFDDFPNDPSEYVDSDKDGIGNNADTDDDNDGVVDSEDAFPIDASESMDTDSDGIGNNADTDDDNDGVEDGEDAFPLDPSESVDTDGDGIGNNADTDDDNDGVDDSNDAYPLDPSRSTNTTTPVTPEPKSDSSGGGTVFWLLFIVAIVGVFQRRTCK